MRSTERPDAQAAALVEIARTMNKANRWIQLAALGEATAEEALKAVITLLKPLVDAPVRPRGGDSANFDQLYESDHSGLVESVGRDGG